MHLVQGPYLHAATQAALPKADSQQGDLESARFTGEFASILSATRRSSTMLMDMLGPVAEQANKAKTSTAKANANDRKTGKSTDKVEQSADRDPSRADRMKEQSARQMQESNEPPRATDERNGDASAGQRSNTPAAGNEADATPRRDTHAAAEPRGGMANTQTTSAADNRQSEPSAQVNTAASMEGTGQAGATNQAGSQVAATSALTAVVSAPSTPSQPAVTAGVASSAAVAEGSTSAAAGRAAQAVTATTATGQTSAAARTTGSNSDFQTAFSAADRSNSAPAKADEAPAAESARTETTGKTFKLDEPGSIKDLASVVRTRIGARHSTMTLDLSPPELGRVRIDVQMHNDELTVKFQPTSAAAHDALQSQAADLKHQLEQQGVHATRVEIQIAPPANEPKQDASGQAGQHAQPWDTPGDQSAQSGYTGHPGAQGDPGFAADGAATHDAGIGASMESDLAASISPALVGSAMQGVDVIV